MLAGVIVWWAVLVRRGHAWWAVIPLALACASKQHLALLLPVLLVWRPFGARRTLATGALTGAADAAVVGRRTGVTSSHDTVTLLVTFHPIRFANTWYLLRAQRARGDAAVLGDRGGVVGVVAAVVAVCPPPARRRRAAALAGAGAAVANLVNKQAFYNQFWLVGALVAASMATRASTSSSRNGG